MTPRYLHNICFMPMPKSRNIAIMSPIHKTENKADCVNYRAITLFNTTYKMLSTIDNQIIKKYPTRRLVNINVVVVIHVAQLIVCLIG